jgi:hypothetical protein
MTVDPPPLSQRATRAVELHNLVADQMREYRNPRERRKVTGEDGKDAWAESEKVTRAWDLTPLLLLLLLPPARRKEVEAVLALRRALSEEKAPRPTLPPWVKELDQEDPLWLQRRLFELGVVGVQDPDLEEREADEEAATTP